MSIEGFQRLDTMLVARSMAPSRVRAQRLIAASSVLVDGVLAKKASMHVREQATITLVGSSADDELRYVSRGAFKLEGALRVFAPHGLQVNAQTQALDIGASTGGFCDVLLQHGVGHVIALDVGHGQLHPRIAANPLVYEMSGVNIRDVSAADLPYRPTLIVSDVSFISLTLVIPVIARLAAPNADVVVLVKPQFEVGKGNLGKNGIVVDEQLRKQALQSVVSCAQEYNLSVLATAQSPIEGTHGNKEYLLYARMC